MSFKIICNSCDCESEIVDGNNDENKIEVWKSIDGVWIECSNCGKQIEITK